MQASGHRFDPDRLHQVFPEMKRNEIRSLAAVRTVTVHFDIVNGFLKSMPWRYGFEIWLRLKIKLISSQNKKAR